MSKKVKFLFNIPFSAFLLMLIGVAANTLLAGAATPSGISLLQQMYKAAQTVPYSGRQTTWRATTPKIVTQIWDNGRMQRMEYLSPPVNKGDIQFDDGIHIWRYHRSENGVVQTPSSSGRIFDPARFSRKYTLRLLGSATIAGRPMWILGISAKNSSKYLRKYWIDKATHLRVRADYYDRNGQRTEATELSSIHFGPISGSRFVWKAPAGATVNYAGELYSHLNYALRQANWLRVPRWLPVGYVFESAVVNKQKNETWLRYSNGARRFSIFEQRTDVKRRTPLQKVDGGWFWKKDGMRYLIAGLSRTDATKLAGSF